MNIKPFRGYRFNGAVVGDPGMCIAPPYDVIDGEQQQALYDRSDYNVVRITKGKPNASDTGQDNVYTRAADFFKQFIEARALVQDEVETIYVYAQEFEVAGQRWRRSGFIALGELEEYGGKIKPHEQTLAGPKADRLNLMRATGANTGQIFMLYSEPEKTVDAQLEKAAEGEPLLVCEDEGVRHTLYAITDPAAIQAIQQALAEHHVFIADGHHRYETALNYSRECNEPAARYCMMTFVNTHNEGLVILPTHRLVHSLATFSMGDLLAAMTPYFDVARMAFGDIVEKKSRLGQMNEALRFEYESGEHAFGMYCDDGAFYVATLRSEAVMAELAPDKSEAWRKLDVAILHKLILEKMMGIDEAALSSESNVEYIKDFGDATLAAIDRVDEGSAQILFFMNTTRPDDVEAVAGHGEKMPQKSTFFYPKIFSGLVINKIV